MSQSVDHLTAENDRLPNTSRFSFTFIDPSRQDYAISRPLSSNLLLDEKLVREKQDIKQYGGADPLEPHSKSPLGGIPSLPPPSARDPNMAGWDGPNDPCNPQNWSTSRKWIITLVCIVMTVNVTFASSAPASAAPLIMEEFHTSKEVSYLVTTVFLLGYAFGPMFWGPGSELIGRRPIFIITLVSYTLSYLGQGLAKNMQTLLVTRFLTGFFGVAPVTNCGGVIADIWSATGRGPAMSMFTASAFLGPALGPVVAGFIVQDHVTWRWVFWVMMIFAGVCTAIMIPLLPETYAPVILLKKAKDLRKGDPTKYKDLYAEHEKQDWSVWGIIQRTIFRPFKMLLMEPILFLVTIYLSIVYGLLYALFQAFPIIFVKIRHFTIGHDGLMFIGIGIGATIAAFLNNVFTRHYPQLIKKWKGFPPPEERLYGAMLGCCLLVISIFWLGWTGQYASVPWYVPGLTTIPIGAAICLMFVSFLSYLVDTYLQYSASAFAANTMVRCAVASAFPLFTTQMFTKLGVNWACTVVGLLGLLFLPAPFLFYKYGPWIRGRSSFAPCVDLVIAKELKEEEKEKMITSQVQTFYVKSSVQHPPQVWIR